MKQEKFEDEVWKAYEKRDLEASDIAQKSKGKVWKNLQINQRRNYKLRWIPFLLIATLAITLLCFSMSKKKEITPVSIVDKDTRLEEINYALEEENKNLRSRLSQLQEEQKQDTNKLESKRTDNDIAPTTITEIIYQEVFIRDTIIVEKVSEPEIIQVFTTDTLYLPAEPITPEVKNSESASVVQFNFTPSETQTESKKTFRNRSLKLKVYK